MDKNKMTIKEFKEFIKTSKGKSTMFFFVYLLFFIFIAIFARAGGTSNINKEYENGSILNFDINTILNNNFKFNYDVNIDGTSTAYVGSSTNKNSLFIINGVSEYYFNGSNYFINSNGLWLNVSDPIKYSQFINVNNIKMLLENATYISKTEYESGDIFYNFQISTASVVKLFEGVDIDIDDLPNEISVRVNEDTNINEIGYVLDSYCKAREICTTRMRINLKYEDFGNVLEIISPLE